MKRSVTVGLFGGSFNPPHMAHLFAVTCALATGSVDRVLVVPAFQHPFDKPLAPYDDRVAMCRAAMEWLPGVEVSRVEEALGGRSWTLRTVQHLRAVHPDWSLRLVIGADLLAESGAWQEFGEICRLAPPLVLGRAGFEEEAAEGLVLPRLSSTEIRAHAAAGRWDALETLVPHAALSYLRAHRLYGAPFLHHKGLAPARKSPE